MNHKINFNDGIKREILLEKNEIQNKVIELGTLISQDYKGKNPVLIGILKGAFPFLADLAKVIDMEVMPEFDFLEVETYNGQEHNTNVKIEKDLSTDISGRDVIIVEDIVDKGHCLTAVLKILNVRKPKSIKICALLSKPEAREEEVKIDYLGFEIPNKWIEGYGLDDNEKLRNLQDIWYRV